MQVRRKLRTLLLVGTTGLVVLSAASAQTSRTVSFNIPPEDLGTALNQAAQQSQQEIAFDAALTRGKQSPGLKGDYTTMQAINILLDSSGLAVRSNGGV